MQANPQWQKADQLLPGDGWGGYRGEKEELPRGMRNLLGWSAGSLS